MARTVDFDKKIEKLELKIKNLKKRLLEAENEYSDLVQRKNEKDMKNLLTAYSQSKKNMSEVIAFLKDDEENRTNKSITAEEI